MGSKVEDAAPSRRRLRSVGTLKTVVVQYGEGSWPEADSDLFSAEQQWCTGFWSSPAESPVCLWIGRSSQSAMCGQVRVVRDKAKLWCDEAKRPKLWCVSHIITWADGLCSMLEWRTAAAKEIRTISLPSPEKLVSTELEILLCLLWCRDRVKQVRGKSVKKSRDWVLEKKERRRRQGKYVIICDTQKDCMVLVMTRSGAVFKPWCNTLLTLSLLCS